MQSRSFPHGVVSSQIGTLYGAEDLGQLKGKEKKEKDFRIFVRVGRDGWGSKLGFFFVSYCSVHEYKQVPFRYQECMEAVVSMFRKPYPTTLSTPPAERQALRHVVGEFIELRWGK